jgi:hypothetical protein
MNKPRIVKDYDKLDPSIVEQIKLYYPRGFKRNLITFKNAAGKFVSALPFETEDRYYLVRMTQDEAAEIIENDEDYNEEGILKKSVKAHYAEKYDDGEEEDDDFDMPLDEIEDIPDDEMDYED